MVAAGGEPGDAVILQLEHHRALGEPRRRVLERRRTSEARRQRLVPMAGASAANRRYSA